MTSNEDPNRVAIAEQAAEWFVTNDEGPLGEQESATLVKWLKASPDNVEEFLGVAVVARDLRAACLKAGLSADAILAQERAGNASQPQSAWWRWWDAVRDFQIAGWQVAVGALLAVGVVSLGWHPWWGGRPVGQIASVPAVAALHFKTGHGEQQTQRLADGSLLHLNTDSAVTVRYGRTERQVTLSSGEVNFEVVHAADRPFRVIGGTAEIVDLGTRFDVRLEGGATLVTVAEGRVAVRPVPEGASGGSSRSDRPSAFVQLKADEQLRVAPDSWPATPVVVDAQRTTAWLHRQIMFDNEPLDRVASEFNRYTSTPIEITAPQLRDLKVSGVFATDNSTAFVAFLRTLDGVQVDVTATRIVVSQK
jgi:transmembrane sensor